MQAGHYDVALDVWLQAALSAPSDRRVITGLTDLGRIRSARGASGGGDDAVQREAERVAAQVRSMVARARDCAETDPALAEGLLTDAMILLRTRDPNGVAAATAIPVTMELARVSQLSRARETRGDIQERERGIQLAAGKSINDAEFQNRRRSSVRQRIRELIDREHYALALQRLREAMRADAEDEELQVIWREVITKLHDQRRLTTREREIEIRNEMVRRIEQDLIPIASDGLIAYAPDWHDRIKRRDPALLSSVEVPAWELTLRDRLTNPVSLDQVDADALELLRMLGLTNGINIIVDPQVASGPPKLMSFTAKRMRLDHAIDWITRQMGTTWAVVEGGVYIGANPQEPLSVSVHDATILGLRFPDAPAVQIGINLGGGQTGSTQSGSLFGAAPSNPADSSGVINPQEFLDLIKRVVEPEYWKNHPEAGLAFTGAYLVATAPPRVQRLIAEFIRQQSSLANLIVSCKVDWLALTDKDVERIGVNWATGSYLVQPNTGLPTTGIYKANNQSDINGTINTPLPFMRERDLSSTSGAGNPISGNNGVSMQYARVGGTQLSAIFNASIRSVQSRQASGVELASLNGLQSTASFIRQVPYIAGYTVVDGTYDPTIKTLNVGTSLTLRPRISADRKYVMVDMEPSVATVEFFRVNITAVNRVAINFSVVQTFPLELPNVALNKVATAVRVPDRGTLLVGGMTSASDQRAETRVPLLSDIPFLGRLFGTRGRLSDRYRLYLLATFTIIDLHEQEILQ